MVMDGLSLDIDELNSQAEQESLMPAELVSCEYRETRPYTDDNGVSTTRQVWQLEWDRLDQDTSNANGEKFLYRSSHNIPSTGQMRRSTLKKQVDCFAKVRLTGKNPEDFLGAKHWIREVLENAGTRFEKAWWKSEAIYIEGQSFEDAIGGLSGTLDTLNAPISTIVDKEDEPEVDQSVYTLLINTVNGKTVRAALTALRNEEDIPEEMVNSFQSGTLQDELIEQGFMKEVEGKFVKVEIE